MYIQYATCAEHPFKIVVLCRSRLPDVRVWRALEEPSRGPTQVLRDWSRTSEERRRHESSRRRGTFNSVWFIPDHKSSVSSSVSIDCCSRRGDLRAEEAEVFLQARLSAAFAKMSVMVMFVHSIMSSVQLLCGHPRLQTPLMVSCCLCCIGCVRGVKKMSTSVVGHWQKSTLKILIFETPSQNRNAPSKAFF